MGNFKFDNVQPGEYLVLVISNNTTDDGTYNFIVFDGYKGKYKKFLGIDILDRKKEYDSIAPLEKAWSDAVTEKVSIWHSGKQIKEMQAKERALTLQKRRVLSMMVEHTGTLVSLPLISLRSLTVQKKMNFTIVTVTAGQNKTFISDFGITYR